MCVTKHRPTGRSIRGDPLCAARSFIADSKRTEREHCWVPYGRFPAGEPTNLLLIDGSGLQVSVDFSSDNTSRRETIG